MTESCSQYGRVRVYTTIVPITSSISVITTTSTAGVITSISVVAPSAAGTPWLRKFNPCSIAMASGWMQIRGTRRRRAMDRGFVLSDHADWDGLLATIEATGAHRIGLTHGQTLPLQRYLTEERSIDAFTLNTEYTGEGGDAEE